MELVPWSFFFAVALSAAREQPKEDRVRRGEIGGAPGAVEAKRTRTRTRDASFFVLRSAFNTGSGYRSLRRLGALRGSVAGQVRVRVGGLCCG